MMIVNLEVTEQEMGALAKTLSTIQLIVMYALRNGNIFLFDCFTDLCIW
jgi:hypothetical protein